MEGRHNLSFLTHSEVHVTGILHPGVLSVSRSFLMSFTHPTEGEAEARGHLASQNLHPGHSRLQLLVCRHLALNMLSNLFIANSAIFEWENGGPRRILALKHGALRGGSSHRQARHLTECCRKVSPGEEKRCHNSETR